MFKALNFYRLLNQIRNPQEMCKAFSFRNKSVLINVILFWAKQFILKSQEHHIYLFYKLNAILKSWKYRSFTF